MLIPFSLPTLAQKREDYATDLEQFHDLNRQMDEHKGALENKVKERSAELQEAEGEFEGITQKVTIAKQRIHNQELSIDEVSKMQLESERGNDALVKASALKQEKRKLLWETQTDAKQTSECLEIAVESYNVTHGDLTILTDGAGALKMSINLENAQSGNQFSLIGVNLRTEVNPYLTDFQAEESEAMVILRRQNQHELDQLVSKEECMTEFTEKVGILENRKEKCEENVEKEREQAEAAVHICFNDITVVESKIKSLRNTIAFEEEIVSYQNQYIQLEALHIKYRNENINKRKEVLDEINSTLRTIKDHNSYVQAQLTAMKDHAVQQRATLRSVILP